MLCYRKESRARDLNRRSHSIPLHPLYGFWRNLWQLKIPPKVKNLLWPAASGVLPTCVNLRIKHVDIPSTCPVCHSAPETISHALLSCHFTSCCWNSMGLPAGIALDDSFPTWLDNIFHKLNDDRVCQMVMVCWSLWKARNSIVWKNKALTVANVLASARISLDHWIKAQDNTSLSSINFHNNGDGAELWTKPDTNTIKINGDAATFAIENRYGYGMVARNDSGIIIDGKAGCNTGTFTPEVAEIIGIKEALSWIKTHN
ncbi:hypothetical protein CsatB_023311 [Cannabis sativa]